MLHVCFIVNFFGIRALQKRIDTEGKLEQTAKENGEDDDLSQQENRSSRDTRLLEDVTFAWCLGTVCLEPLQVQRFQSWKLFPGQIGIWTTCFSVVLGSILLSRELMVDKIGVSTGSLDSGLCIFEDYDRGLANLQDRLERMKNFSIAQRQHRVMVDFSAALVNDTSLYGFPPYDCARCGNVSGLKKDWNCPGTFFPGYCSKAPQSCRIP